MKGRDRVEGEGREEVGVDWEGSTGRREEGREWRFWEREEGWFPQASFAGSSSRRSMRSEPEESHTQRSWHRREQTAANMSRTLQHGSGSLHSSDVPLSDRAEEPEVWLVALSLDTQFWNRTGRDHALPNRLKVRHNGVEDSPQPAAPTFALGSE